jgi:hypothetical protein
VTVVAEISYTVHFTELEECELRILDYGALRRIFGAKRDVKTGEWRRLHNEQLYALYSPNINRVIKSRRQRWAGV